MIKETKDILKNKYNISDNVFNLYMQTMEDINEHLLYYDQIREYNQIKVLNAFRDERISDYHFTNSTGYGYDDIGRDSLDKLYANIFNCEAGLVRPHFVSGTHAIGCAIFGNLRPKDTMLSVCGAPYDTLHNVIGIGNENNIGSLNEYGINYKQINLNCENNVDIDAIKDELLKDKSIKMVHIQRSTGYDWRHSLQISEIEEIVDVVKSINKDIICFVDNCYGEFVDILEPTEVGADLMAGSLIKNMGGGIAPTGGYIVGKQKYVDQSAYRLTMPGIGGECGSTFGVMRSFFQGLFLAPHISIEAVKSAIFCSRVMNLAGFEVLPRYDEKRSDIIQAIKFNDEQKLVDFCNGIQSGSPIDSYAKCVPSEMPGYDNEIIMAAGTFIQGASIELSTDAPLREPYIAYYQGGLTFDHAKTGIIIALNNII